MNHHRRHKPLPSRSRFYRRLSRNGLIALGILAASLGLGMAGYHTFEGTSWLDSFLNASMILGGMGQVDPLRTGAGKLFAGCYALFSGIVFLTSAAVLFAPVLHRFQHKLHLDIEADEDDKPPQPTV